MNTRRGTGDMHISRFSLLWWSAKIGLCVASTAIVLYKAFSGGEEGHGAMTLYRNSIVTRT
jgi:hypothetical protein